MTEGHPHDPARENRPEQSATPKPGEDAAPAPEPTYPAKAPVPKPLAGYARTPEQAAPRWPNGTNGLVLAGASTPVWAARAIVGVGAIAAATVVGNPLGLGVALVLLALGAIGAAVPRAVELPTVDLRVAEPDGRDPWLRVWWVLAAALAVVPFLRAASWVVVPAVITAVAVASLAATGGRRWGQLAAGLGALWALLPVGPLLAGRVAARGMSLRPAGPAARGVALAAVLLAAFVPLLMSADAAFAQLVDDVVPSGWAVEMPVERTLVLTLFVALGGALVYARLRPPNVAPVPARFTIARLETQIALGSLVALFAAFVALQFATLFGGDTHVVNTTGLTYAEYARSGFAQLLAVAALTFAVIAAARRWAQGGSLLLAALCVLTLVVLASALKRLGLYEETFGFTRLRLAAHAALLYLGALFCLVLFARSATWLPRAIVATTAAAVLIFALADPERRIVDRNADRFERTGRLDVGYLYTLGADAAPALARLRGKGPACVRQRLRLRLEPDGLAGFNLARARARDVLEKESCYLSA